MTLPNIHGSDGTLRICMTLSNMHDTDITCMTLSNSHDAVDNKELPLDWLKINLALTVLEIFRLSGDRTEDEEVCGNHGDQWNDEENEYGDGAVESFLPVGRVRAKRDALVELSTEGTTGHSEYVRLRKKTTRTK